MAATNSKRITTSLQNRKLDVNKTNVEMAYRNVSAQSGGACICWQTFKNVTGSGTGLVGCYDVSGCDCPSNW